MDLDKRMNLSLDEIIKKEGGSRGPKKSVSRGKFQGRGKGPVKIAGLSKRGGGNKTTGAKPQNKVLTVQRSSLKKQGGASKRSIPQSGSAKSKDFTRPNTRVAPRNQNLSKRVNSSLSNGNKQTGRKPQARNFNVGNVDRPQKQPKRIVDLPKLTDLRITIRNDQAIPIQQPSLQSNWGVQPIQHPTFQQSQAPYGYGPRNLAPRDERANGSGIRTASQYPVPQRPSNYGVGRKAMQEIGSQQIPVHIHDYDQPQASGSYMRMDQSSQRVTRRTH